jgi:hypothetical protein
MDFSGKILGPREFSELTNYCSIEKGIDRVYGPVDWVHGSSSRVHEILIKPERSIWLSMA